ncbi:MAG: RNA-binding protein [Omnitrophica bacterium RIFCSPLOWO2_12_FULL_44_17]|uniref:RNA-binding protein n=1 Tax=Candidatus Danuiimicrobium aquiferis TaxID=1801832 RepID=A0A1G1L1N1_9BACT|nr:MAG: RNA-binding protein [Omnitrophica bacterium RIFCSPHIGHO2_02_FULL_45_28]OGW98799.1 MAG: RNA-binding protein [Omnitrophica bacterium RIFCSPLOWO2_12_FULL_44_17]OGX02505.1 MAG: RNA-binding protein [Omnitrophica bacterium RIFCSPLOWO2_02_FULL_44_11]
MQTKLYVGNLSYQATAEEIKQLFVKFGEVKNVDIITDRFSGRSKGFAFVEMGTPEEAEKALELNGTEFGGRNLNVSEAKPREPRTGGGGGGGYRGGQGGGGGFGGKRRGGGGFGGGHGGGNRGGGGRDRGDRGGNW